MGKEKSSSELVPVLHFTGTPSFYRCEPSWSWTPPPLEDYDLWFVLDGQGTLELGLHKYILQSGSCFVFAPGAKLHATQHPAHRLHVFACHFNWKNPAALPASWRRTRHWQLRDAQFFSDLARRCLAAYHREDDWNREYSRRLLEMMLWHFEGDLKKPEDVTHEAVLELVVRAVREEPGAAWNVKEMARRVGLSPSQFTRRFRAGMNVSPNHFVIQTRLERARQLLRETDMTVGAIAHALGYRDAHFFCRQFKAFTGHTPGSIRRN